MSPDTASLTCKRQYGSSGQLKKHVDEERIKSDLDPHVDQEPHQMFGQEHVVEWCELGFDNEMTMTMKYFILTEKQCNIINQKCIKLKYCHGDHIKTKKMSIAYDHQCC